MDGYTGPATGLVEIDLGALVRNFATLKALAGSAECAAAVKANAYGHGVREVVPVLLEEGCDTFFVATPNEGQSVRAVAPISRIYILDGLLPGIADYYLTHDLRPALGTLEELREWTEATRAPAALHIDTGMNRLGLSPGEVAMLREDATLRRSANITLVLSHLACADDPQNPMNERQRMAFDDARTLFPDAKASLAGSGAIFLGSKYHYDCVRVGIALFGGRAVNNTPKPTEPVATLYGRVLQVRDNWNETTIGYGATRSIASCRRIATIGTGYADGLSRHLSASDGETGGTVFCAGQRVPIIGRVSMDLITIDVSELPDSAVNRGDWVEIFGRNIDVDDLAEQAGTIGYELLTQLGPRYARRTIPHQGGN